MRPPLPLLAALLLAAPCTVAHVVNTPSGYTRMVYDLSHDWGWESGCSSDKGHELNSIDVIEKRVNGEFLLVVQPLMVKATQGPAEGAPYRTRETLSFQGPRGAVTTTVDSTAEGHLDFVDGVRPVWLGPRNHGPYEPGDSTYEFQLGWEIGYRYSDLQVQSGDFLSAFTMQAFYEEGGQFHKGDYMPGGYWTAQGTYHAGASTNCSPNSGGVETPYVADGYTVQHSNWFPAGSAVGDAPQADFGTDPPAPQPSQAITFQDASTSPSGRSLAAWRWDFGDGSQSNQREPQHVFTAAGTYAIQLTVTDDAGKVGNVERDLHVAAAVANGGQQNIPPQVNFRVDTPRPIAGSPVAFEDTSFDQDGAVASYSWDFGDGAVTALSHSPSHTYAEAGIYQVTHSVTDDGGLASRVVKEVTVAGGDDAGQGGGSAGSTASVSAIADFSRTPLAPTALDTVKFHDASQPGDRPITAWTWSFGDNTTATGAQATHQYAKPGRYFVTLSIRQEGSPTPLTVRKEVVVQNLAPIASFHAEPAQAQVGQPIRLVDNSTDRDGHIVEWEWYLGGALPSFGREQQATFDSPGTYTLTLTITDDLGITGTAQVDVQVTADGAVPHAQPLAGATKGAPDAGILVGIALLGLAATRRR
jgi:PKD repeat protein